MGQEGVCLICRKSSNLQLSHAIGNSVFRAITKREKLSGKAILIDANNDRIRTTQESYPEYQLCSHCEKKLNVSFENTVLSMLRGHRKINKSTYSDGYIVFSEADPYQIKMYFLSIWLRAAKSSQELYRNIGILSSQEELIREAIDTGKKIKAQDFPVRLSRLDNKGTPFDKDFITCFTDILHSDPRVVFIFEGFSAEIYLEKLFQKRRKKNGVLGGRKGVLKVSVMDIQEVFPIEVLYDYINNQKEQNNIDESVIKIIQR